MLFKILWTIDALGALVILFFLIAGLTDGTINERNGGLWTALVLITVGVLAGSICLKVNNHPGLAYFVVLIMAIPAFLYGLFILVAANSKWN